jgi:hypothetical protein
MFRKIKKQNQWDGAFRVNRKNSIATLFRVGCKIWEPVDIPGDNNRIVAARAGSKETADQLASWNESLQDFFQFGKIKSTPSRNHRSRHKLSISVANPPAVDPAAILPSQGEIYKSIS